MSGDRSSPDIAPPVRENGIDAFRYLLMVPVIFGHAWPMLSGVSLHSFANLPYAVGHCAVPFFFVASGYFLRLDRGGPFDVTLWTLRKLVPVYLLWITIYWLAATPLFLNLRPFSFRQILAGGIGFHLWFLPALGVGLAATSIVVRVCGLRLAGLLFTIAALVGLARGSYHNLLDLPGESARGALLIAPLFVLVGVLIRRASPPRDWRLFGLLSVLFYVVQIVEDTVLVNHSSFRMRQNIDYTFATFGFGIAVFLFARSLPAAPFAGLARLGKLTLGIYCVHLLVIFALFEAMPMRGALYACGITAATLLISTALSMGFRSVLRSPRLVGMSTRLYRRGAGYADTDTACTRAGTTGR